MTELLSHEFRAEVDSRSECVVRLFGELDLERAEHVYDLLVARPEARILVDMSNMDFIDSSGISALLVARRSLESDGRSLELRGARSVTRRVFEVLGLTDVLDD